MALFAHRSEAGGTGGAVVGILGGGPGSAGCMLVVIEFANAGASGASVAVAGAVGAEEAGAGAGVMAHGQRGGIAVRLTRAAFRGGAGRVVLVEAMAELVEEDVRQLAGVAAAAARLEEVYRG